MIKRWESLGGFSSAMSHCQSVSTLPTFKFGQVASSLLRRDSTTDSADCCKEAVSLSSPSLSENSTAPSGTHSEEPTEPLTDLDLQEYSLSIPVECRLEVKQPPTGGYGGKYELTAAASTRQGLKRAYPSCPNQDVHLIVPLSAHLMMVAVFDGHGREGHHSASCVRDQFKHHARSLASLSGWALKDALESLCRHAQDLLQRKGLANYSGTTATVAMIDMQAGRVLVAHVGDSTLRIMKSSEVVAATRDHRVDKSAERRILAHGGVVRSCVTDSKTQRICAPGSDFPGLAMARCLGDQEAQKLGASCEPEFDFFPFCPESSLIVASDGVWDVLPPDDAAWWLSGPDSLGLDQDYYTVQERCGSLANKIVDEARKLYPTNGDIDDITAVVVQAWTSVLI